MEATRVELAQSPCKGDSPPWYMRPHVRHSRTFPCTCRWVFPLHHHSHPTVLLHGARSFTGCSVYPTCSHALALSVCREVSIQLLNNTAMAYIKYHSDILFRAACEIRTHAGLPLRITSAVLSSTKRKRPVSNYLELQQFFFYGNLRTLRHTLPLLSLHFLDYAPSS